MPNTRWSYDYEYQAALAEEAQRQYDLANPFESYLPPDEERYSSNFTYLGPSGLREKLIAEKDINPNAYYGEVTKQLSNIIFENSRLNKNEYNASFYNDLEAIKEINPNAYYTGKLALLGRLTGWDYGQNTPERSASRLEEIKSMVPDAIKAGISPEQFDSIVGSNINDFRAWNQQRIATDAANGGSGFSFTKDVLPGITFVGGAALGAAGPAALGLNAAQAAGLAAATAGLSSAAKGASFEDILKNAAIGGALSYGLSGDTFFDSTSVALGGSGDGGNFVPTAGNSFSIDPFASYTSVDSFSPFQGPTYGELGYTGVEGDFAGPTYEELGYTGVESSFAIDPSAAYTTAGSVAPLTTAEILSSTGFTPTAESSFSIDPSAAYTTAGSYLTPNQMEPTYQELGVTGVPEGGMGPTYEELGYTGLNQNEAIATADAASEAAARDLTGEDAASDLTGEDASKYIKYAVKAYDTASKLSKLLKSSSGQGASSSGQGAGQAITGGENTGLDIGKLANMLSAPQQTNSYIGQIKGNETPFFGSNQGSLIGTNVYDVSGSNPMANALRKR